MAIDRQDWAPAVTAGLFTLGGSGVKKVAVTSTAVALAAATMAQQVMLRARKSNVGLIYVGAANVTNDEAATGGLQLGPGDMVAFPIGNLALVFINGNAGDGVSYLYWS